MALSNTISNIGEMYCLTFANGKKYVGITTVGVRKRYMRHRNSANSNSGSLVHKAWRKYGEPSLCVMAIADKDYLMELEKRAIRLFDVMHPNGYNMASGGQGGITAGSEIAKRISATKKARKQGPSKATIAAVIAANTGRKATAETRAKLSMSRTGRYVSDETRIKLSDAQRGKKRSPEAVEKNRQSHIGLTQSAETIEKRRRKMIGHRWPDESYATGWETRRSNRAKQQEKS